MNAVVDHTAEKVTELRTAGPGERLRAARLSQGLEVAKVAAQLHLSEEMVHALERDEYDALPGRVFVRGYLRNYARLVGLAPDSLLKQFDERFPDSEAVRTLSRVGTSVRPEVHSSHGGMRFVTLLIVLTLIGLFVAWWKGYLSWLSQDGALLSVAPRSELPAPAAPDDGLSLPPLAPSAAEPDVPPTSAPAEFTAPAPGAADGPAQLPPPAPPAATEAPPATLAPAGTAAATDEPAAPAAPASGIVLEFTAPCWVDVRDTKRNFKLFGEMPKGARKTLGGEPPYKVVLGNASAVRVTVDGVPYDISRHASGNVARFTLDPPRSNP